MQKRIWAWILAMTLVLTVFPCSAVPAHGAEAAGELGEEVEWALDDDGSLTISGRGPMEEDAALEEEIWDQVYRVEVRDGVTSIAPRLFANMENLTDVELPDSLEVIGSQAFRETALTEIHLPEGLKEIGALAFYACSGITRVEIPASVEKIGDGAFWENFRTAQEGPVGYAVEEGNPAYWADARGVLFNKEKTRLIHAPENVFLAAGEQSEAWDTYEVPEGVRELAPYAFAFCGLREISLPESLERIEDYAFQGMEKLERVVFSGNAPQLGTDCFDRKAGSKLKLYYKEGKDGWSGEAWQDYSLEELHEHRYTATVTDPTCTEGGYTTYSCVCGDFYTQDQTNPLDHDYKARVTQPSCGAAGYTTYICTRCADSYMGDPTAALGHDYESKVTAPSCTDRGWTEHRCRRCADSYRDAATAALGHSYKTGRCTRCGAQDPNWTAPTEPVPTEPKPNEPKPTEPKPTEPAPTEPEPTVPPANPFTDVKPGKYYYDAVQWAVRNQVTNGVDETHFAPSGTCTRGEIATFLWRAAGSPEPQGTRSPFVDVTEGSYYTKAVLWAAEAGITNGTDAAHFRPGAPCTRGQVACFLYRFRGWTSKGENPFRDVSQGSYYYEAVLWAAEAGITNGTDPSHFSPQQRCSRGEIVCFLFRLMKEAGFPH